MGTYDKERNWARQYIKECKILPSIDDLARAADKAGMTMPKDVIIQIRREMRSSMAHVIVPLTPSVSYEAHITKKCTLCGKDGHWAGQCPEPPIISNVRPEPPTKVMLQVMGEGIVQQAFADAADRAVSSEPPKGPQPLPQIDPVEVRRKTALGTRMRMRYLNDRLDADPGVEPIALQEEMRQKFGIGLGNRIIYEHCRIAREIANLPPIRKQNIGSHEPCLPRPGKGWKADLPSDAPQEVKIDEPEGEEEDLDAYQGLPFQAPNAVYPLDESLVQVADALKDLAKEHKELRINIEMKDGKVTITYEQVIIHKGKLEV